MLHLEAKKKYESACDRLSLAAQQYEIQGRIMTLEGGEAYSDQSSRSVSTTVEVPS